MTTASGYLFVGGPSHAFLLEPSPALRTFAAHEWIVVPDGRYVLGPGTARWSGVYYHSPLLDEAREAWLKDAESIWERLS